MCIGLCSPQVLNRVQIWPFSWPQTFNVHILSLCLIFFLDEALFNTKLFLNPKVVFWGWLDTLIHESVFTLMGDLNFSSLNNPFNRAVWTTQSKRFFIEIQNFIRVFCNLIQVLSSENRSWRFFSEGNWIFSSWSWTSVLSVFDELISAWLRDSLTAIFLPVKPFSWTLCFW